MYLYDIIQCYYWHFRQNMATRQPTEKHQTDIYDQFGAMSEQTWLVENIGNKKIGVRKTEDCIKNQKILYVCKKTWITSILSYRINYIWALKKNHHEYLYYIKAQNNPKTIKITPKNNILDKLFFSKNDWKWEETLKCTWKYLKWSKLPAKWKFWTISRKSIEIRRSVEILKNPEWVQKSEVPWL